MFSPFSVNAMMKSAPHTTAMVCARDADGLGEAQTRCAKHRLVNFRRRRHTPEFPGVSENAKKCLQSSSNAPFLNPFSALRQDNEQN